MAKTIGRLTALRVSRLTDTGMHADGGGLYLQVTAAGAKSWIFRYMLGGKAREMGLGSARDISLADARMAATAARAQRLTGIDPIAARNAVKASRALEDAKSVTFRQAWEEYVDSHKSKWRNAKHVGQWTSTLETYAGPIIGHLPVAAVDTDLVLKVLQPIWTTKPETAGRLRGRIENVLDWARVRGRRTGENPARWRGHLQHLLPAHSKRKNVKHHPAMPYNRVPGFMESLRLQDGLAPQALELTILTAARTGETIGAQWAEIDLVKKVWTVPGERMKGEIEHRKPLSDRAVEILTALPRISKYVFPGQRSDTLSNMAMLAVLERMGEDQYTVHGFRSSFRDWAEERTTFDKNAIEMALAHTIPDPVEAAYRRGDLFEKRVQLMSQWADYCAKPAAEIIGSVVALRAV